MATAICLCAPAIFSLSSARAGLRSAWFLAEVGYGNGVGAFSTRFSSPGGAASHAIAHRLSRPLGERADSLAAFPSTDAAINVSAYRAGNGLTGTKNYFYWMLVDSAKQARSAYRKLSAGSTYEIQRLPVYSIVKMAKPDRSAYSRKRSGCSYNHIFDTPQTPSHIIRENLSPNTRNHGLSCFLCRHRTQTRE